jgi:hypothetical protein
MFLWIAYSIFEGWREAHYWFHRTNSPYFEQVKNIDQHNLFVAQRGIPLLLMGYIAMMLSGSFIITGLVLLGNALLFSFFHNGMMYTVRNWISKKITPNHIVYPKRWLAQSSSSQAKLTFLMGPTSRTIQAVIGIISYIVTIIL